jgi:hypothetical protein
MRAVGEAEKIQPGSDQKNAARRHPAAGYSGTDIQAEETRDDDRFFQDERQRQ